jgi:hypothetical protein
VSQRRTPWVVLTDFWTKPREHCFLMWPASPRQNAPRLSCWKM